MNKIKNLYLYLFCVIGLLAACLTAAVIIAVVIFQNGEKYARYLIEKHTYISDVIRDDRSIPDNEKATEYFKWYTKVISLHMSKFRSESLTKQVQADLILKMWKYTDWFNFPKNYFLCTGLMESGFNPKAKGPCGERGMWQQHPTVMSTVELSLYRLKKSDPWLARKLDPKIKHHGELYDNPVASLKCQVLIALYARSIFKRNIVWWVSGAHWGPFRLRRFYVDHKMPPMRFTFFRINKKTGKKEVTASRNPLVYYTYYENISAKMNRRRTDFYREYAAYTDWIKRCDKEEKEFLEARRYLNRLHATKLKMERKIKNTQSYFKSYKKLIDQTNKKMENIYGRRIIRQKNYPKGYKETKSLFKQFVSNLKKIKRKLKKQIK